MFTFPCADSLIELARRVPAAIDPVVFSHLRRLSFFVMSIILLISFFTGQIFYLLDFFRIEWSSILTKNIVFPIFRFRKFVFRMKLEITFSVHQTEVNRTDLFLLQNGGYIKECIYGTINIFRTYNRTMEWFQKANQIFDMFGSPIAMEAHHVAIFTQETADGEIGIRMSWLRKNSNGSGKWLSWIHLSAPLPQPSE